MAATPDTFRADNADPGLMGPVRADRVAVVGGSQIERTPEGFLRIPVRFAKAPMVLQYRTRDGVIREFVPASTIFDPASLETMRDKPLGIEHPKLNPPKVDPTNVGRYMRGHVSSGMPQKVTEGGIEYAETSVVVMDQESIALIERALSEGGSVEVSPGYEAGVANTPGTHSLLGDYDRVQVRRVYNHLALTVRGRSGPDVALKLDSSGTVVRVDSYDLGGAPADTHPTGGSMPPFLNLLAAALLVRIDADDTEATATDKVLDAAKAAKANAARADSLSADVDSLTEALRMDASTLRGRVDALLKGAKMDMADLAKAMDMKPDALSDMLAGKGEKKMDAAMVAKLSKTIGADMDEMQKLADACWSPKEDKTDSDILAESLAWSRTRAALEARADSLGLEREATDKLDNAGLVRAVVIAHGEKTGAEVKADAEDAYYAAAFDLLPEVKADSAKVWAGVHHREPPKGDDKTEQVRTDSTPGSAWTRNFKRKQEELKARAKARSAQR